MQSFNTTIIPYWVKDQLDENLQDVSALLDPEQIDALLSPEDQVFMAGLQSLDFGATENLFPTIGAGSYKLIDAWEKNNQARFVSQVDSFNQDIDRYSKVADQFSLYDHDDNGTVKFRIVDLNAGQVGVVIYPAFFTAQARVDSLTQLDLMREILEVWYKYFSYAEVYPTSLYRRYLELLRLEQSVA